MNRITLGMLEYKAYDYKPDLDKIEDISYKELTVTNKGGTAVEISFLYKPSDSYSDVVKKVGLAYAKLCKYIAKNESLPAKEDPLLDFGLRSLKSTLYEIDTEDSNKIIVPGERKGA